MEGQPTHTTLALTSPHSQTHLTHTKEEVHG